MVSVFMGREEQSVVILSLKKFRKEVGREVEDGNDGSMVGDFRERMDWSVDHSFLGCLEQFKTSCR